MICPNCGNEIDNTVSECPNCGFQMTATESVKENHIQNESQSLNYDNINQTTAGKSLIKPKMSKKKKIIFIILAIILAFLIGRVIEVIINNINHNSSSSYSDVVSDFTIEGTWRNIGNTTCAQIQKGSVVNFDGENCNVYSPNDTYAFYESDGVYHLDCTSFFAGDSLCFTVNIIDYDNIELVSSNSTIIQLCRSGGTPNTTSSNTSITEKNTQEVYVYSKEKGPICYTADYNYNTLILYQYVIDENEYYEVSRFNIGNYSLQLNELLEHSNLLREQFFNSDLTKLAVSYGKHVGWIDNAGNFTDVTDIIHPSSSDFSSKLPYDTDALFTSDDLLFFVDNNSNKFCYFDAETNQIKKTISFTYRNRLVFEGLDRYDNPMKGDEKITSDFTPWYGEPKNTPYVIGDDYLTTKQGELHITSCWDGNRGYDYILAWGPGFTDFDSSDNAYCIEYEDKYAITPESEYKIEDLVARENTILFYGKRDSEEYLFRMDVNDFKATDPKILGEFKYPFLFWQK